MRRHEGVKKALGVVGEFRYVRTRPVGKMSRARVRDGRIEFSCTLSVLDIKL